MLGPKNRRCISRLTFSWSCSYDELILEQESVVNGAFLSHWAVPAALAIALVVLKNGFARNFYAKLTRHDKGQTVCGDFCVL